MELWEFNACMKSYNLSCEKTEKRAINRAWLTANFTGAAYAGKLKKLENYTKLLDHKQGPKVSKEQFEEKLQRAEAAQRR